MKGLLEIIAKALVDKPENVKVTEVQSLDGIKLELRVAPEDIGKVIGKQGKIARAIRTIIKASAVKEKREEKVFVNIVQ